MTDDKQASPSTPSGSGGGLSSNRWLLIGLAVALGICLLTVTAMVTRMAGNSKDTRTVTVTGDATVKASPDEFVFYPSYNFQAADKDAALAQLTKKSEDVTAGLKKLGVADKDIKSNTGGYDQPTYTLEGRGDDDMVTYNLQLTVNVTNKELVQKVQDYLVSTAPTGGVSPQSDFSDSKRKQLESQARDEATKDARAKADQSAKNLGFKVGKVQSIKDGDGFGSVRPFAADGAEPAIAENKSSLTVQPGENELSYSVTVVYQIH